MSQHPTPSYNNRIGFHYFADTHHYRQSDLEAWLPELAALGARWLTLVAPNDRAIPEPFIKGLIEAGIEPILHVHLSLKQIPQPNDLNLVIEAYASWGVNYITLFNRPNCHDQWPDNRWVQQDLVERFLDVYIPLAETICQAGMIPVFPPLEPGGDFWDTAFLRSALQSIQQRGHQRLLDQLVIGAYGWASNRPPNWGAGGPERWPGARPYFTPEGEEDHLGFRIFDWYTAISEAVLGKKVPIILLGLGSRSGNQHVPNNHPIDHQEHADRNLNLARLLAGEEPVIWDETELEAVPDHVLAGNFWLLTADSQDSSAEHAWYRPDGSTLPAVEAFKTWTASRTSSEPVEPKAAVHPPEPPGIKVSGKPIAHYLLLPIYEWGVANWHLEVTRPFIKKHHPTVGFSVEEAMNAGKVTIVGGEQSFPDELAEQLRASGCVVVQISGDGTTIASQLETL